MKNKSPIIKVNILVCFLVILLLSACSPGKPMQNVREDESTAVDVPADPPTESERQPPSDKVVWMEDMVYPGAEFLLEVDGIGGPMNPWRFYTVPNASGEKLAEYYKQQLYWFDVEHDEIVDGIRYLGLAHPEPMDFMDGIEDIEEMQEISKAMDGYLLSLEVTHSNVGYEWTRLSFAAAAHDIADQIPPNTTIIILEYYKDLYHLFDF
ncbi:MAG TPA: hypothetical protein PLE10_07710 [Brevefilum sp.]|nr:hypothetical protein [Brevefilum sp.]HOR19692.1 hypothetical protein [Brevefilum sp.]HPL69519.1 hypothetical protein [Brevefilum sp.]